MAALAGSSKYAMTQQRINAREFFCDGERIVTRGDAELRERHRDAFGNRRTRERMWQSFEFCVIFEGNVRSFVGGNERKDRSALPRALLGVPCRGRDEMRFGAAWRMELPRSQIREVIASSSHGVVATS
jgi:hypothetical protein